MTVSVVDATTGVFELDRRMPLHFGDVVVNEGPHLLMGVTIDLDGTISRGISMGGIAPMWFIKDPSVDYVEGSERLLDVVRRSLEVAKDSTADSPFALWREIYDDVIEWCDGTTYPELLGGYGVSLVEIAMIDATCRAHGQSFATAIRSGTFGVELETIHPELAGQTPGDLLPPSPKRSAALRHTVGQADPLAADDLDPEAALEDGLPQTLSEVVETYGVDHFKIKLNADLETDRNRLAAIERTLTECGLDSYAFTVDANEGYESAEDFKSQWSSLRADPTLEEFFEQLLYVEQPLPRSAALHEDTGAVFNAWPDRPLMIIDESDDRLESLPRALDQGYHGTSHKNCKGVFKGVANACLLAARGQENQDRAYVMSAEDLTTTGPVELQQDLAVQATLGMDHIERNGHHYYRGLSGLDSAVQSQLVERHGDLFEWHDSEFATVRIEDGRISFESVLDAPFGYDISLDIDRYPSIEEWSPRDALESV